MTKLMILRCPDVVAPGGHPVSGIVDTLKTLRAAGNPVAITSNGTQPPWFSVAFAGSKVQFLQEFGRQDGKIIAENAKRMSLPSHNTLVLAGKNEDVQMAKNGGGPRRRGVVRRSLCEEHRHRRSGRRRARAGPFAV